MKRLLLFAAVLGLTSAAYAQVPKKVLIEEFTNTGCPPCAATDPIVEEWESENIENVVFLKWHVDWPSDNDPYNLANANEPKRRGPTYYKVSGVPTFFVNGAKAAYSNVASLEPALNTAFSDARETTSPFELSVVHSIVGDSIIANVTVKLVGEAPADTDLRLAAVFAERYNQFLGTNGRLFHTSIVRKVAPGLATTGAIATGGALTIAAGETQTLRFAAEIGETWNRDQLMSVAFIQSAATKEVHQAGWTLPSVRVTPPADGMRFVPALGGDEIKLENLSSEPIRVKLTPNAGALPNGWTMGFEGATNNIVELAANETKTINMNMAVPSVAKGSGLTSVYVSQVDAEGNSINGLGGTALTYFGKQTSEVVVDAGTGMGFATPVLEELQKTHQAAALTSTELLQNFNNWSQFKYVFYLGGLSTALYTDDGSWDQIENYLAGGGNLFVSSAVGPNAYKLSKDEGLMDLWRNNLGVEPDTAWTFQSGWNGIVGKANDPITGDYTDEFTMQYNLPYLQTVGVAAPYARPILFASTGDTIGVRNYNGPGKSVFLGIGLEYLRPQDRADITEKIIAWFNAPASVKISEAATSEKLANYPNPFNPSTTIEFSVTEAAPVTLVVKDMMGREIATLIDFQMHTPGTYQQAFDASSLASGTYIYELTAGSKKITEKMILNK